MKQQEAPFYLRRTKEALVAFPDPDTGDVRKLFTKREVGSAAFDLDGEELDFYDGATSRRIEQPPGTTVQGDRTGSPLRRI